MRAIGFGLLGLALCQCTSPDSARMPAAAGGDQTQGSAGSAVTESAAQHADDTSAGSLGAAPSGSNDAAASQVQPVAKVADAREDDAGAEPAADGGTMTASMPATEDSSCLDLSADYAAPGGFDFDASSVGRLKLWLPKLPAGCKAPVVHFANGTGAACSSYQPVLERFASHGFLTVCSESTSTGSGVLGVDALAAVLELYPDLAAHKLGSAGHEAGGQGAILTQQQAEAKWGTRALYAGLAIAPSSGHGSQPPGGSWKDAYAALQSPMLFMSGTEDALVSERWVGDGYELLNDAVEGYWYSGIGAVHIPIPHDYIQELAIGWFRWKLLGDQAACRYFRRLPDSERWDERGSQNAKLCL